MMPYTYRHGEEEILISSSTTIRDLTNARYVLEHAGHTTNTLLDAKSGSVCLDGAIALATSGFRLTSRANRFGEPRFWGSPAFNVAASARRRAALDALAPLLPDSCREHGYPFLPTPDDRVWHFNDQHCAGGAEADSLLREAAEKLQADL